MGNPLIDEEEWKTKEPVSVRVMVKIQNNPSLSVVLENAFSRSSIVLKLISACPFPSKEMFDVFILLCIIKFETSLELFIFLLEPDIIKEARIILRSHR